MYENMTKTIETCKSDDAKRFIRVDLVEYSHAWPVWSMLSHAKDLPPFPLCLGPDSVWPDCGQGRSGRPRNITTEVYQAPP